MGNIAHFYFFKNFCFIYFSFYKADIVAQRFDRTTSRFCLVTQLLFFC